MRKVKNDIIAALASTAAIFRSGFCGLLIGNQKIEMQHYAGSL